MASVISGGSFGAGLAQGAIGGAIGGATSAFFTSQQYQNLAAGKGFVSNATLEARQAKLVAAIERGDLQGAADQFRQNALRPERAEAEALANAAKARGISEAHLSQDEITLLRSYAKADALDKMPWNVAKNLSGELLPPRVSLAVNASEFANAYVQQSTGSSIPQGVRDFIDHALYMYDYNTSNGHPHSEDSYNPK